MQSSLDAYQRYRDVRFFGCLDGLRFLAIGAVLWHHGPVRDALQQPLQLLQRGFAGVDLFFVLSGFLITTLLLREEARDGTFSLAGFYRRRILRIVPVYYLLVTLVAVYWIGVKGEYDYAPLVPYYYLFQANFLTHELPLLSPTWSLSVEEQYYVLWPALLLLMPVVGKTRPVVLGLLITICVLSAAGFLTFLGIRPIVTEHVVWTFAATGYSAILIGSLAALILHHPKGFSALYRLFAFRWAPVIAFLALIVVLNETPGDLRGWPNLLMHLTMAICLITIVIREDNILRPFLAARPVARIGVISYGLYLYHLIGLHIANVIVGRLGLDGWAALWTVTVMYIAISIVIAEISFRTFERYFLSLRYRRWKRQKA